MSGPTHLLWKYSVPPWSNSPH